MTSKVTSLSFIIPDLSESRPEMNSRPKQRIPKSRVMSAARFSIEIPDKVQCLLLIKPITTKRFTSLTCYVVRVPKL